MRPKTLSLVAALFIAAPAFAQTVEFSTLDQDANGSISLTEFLILQETVFYEIDTNGDGLLDIAEVTHAISVKGLPKRGVKKAMQRDADGDSLLNLTEFLSDSPAFHKADRNNDGGLQQAEFAKANEYLVAQN